MEAERAKVEESKKRSVAGEERASTQPMKHPCMSSFREPHVGLKLYKGHVQEEEESAQESSANTDLGTDGESTLQSIEDTESEESEEERGRWVSHPSCSGPGNNTKSINVSIDPDVLYCSYCFTPLRAPLFECDNGHVACSICCLILENKCHVCSLPTGRRRCRALETVIEAMKIPCPNSRFGCELTIPYTRKYTHEESCIFAPCSCPVSSCTFQGPTACLSRHIKNEHRSTTPQRSFSYNRFFKVALQPKEPFFVLHGKDGRIFLLLNVGSEPHGNSLSIACMRPGSSESDLGYKIMVKGKGSELRLKASPKSIRELEVGSPAESFLVVPHEISDSSGVISIDVLIRKM